MISCQKCLHDNPLGTVFCRSCGTRLVVNLADVEASVIGQRQASSDEKILRTGISATTLSLFLVVCALILNLAIVPAMPPLDLPSPVLGQAIPSEVPGWAAVVAPAAAAVQSGQGAPAKEPELGERLKWRRSQVTYLLGSLGIDLVTVRAWQDELCSDQQPDGSWSGGDALAATALNAAALQAAALTPTSEGAARRARDFLRAHSTDLSQRTSLVRSLTALTLFDAEELGEAQRAALSVYLLDGGAPLWQAYLLPLYRNDSRPGQYPALSTALHLGIAGDYFALLAGTTPGASLALYRTPPAGAEEHLLWAFTAWANPVSPKDLAADLVKCSQAAPPPVSSELSKACGTHAPTAVALLTVGAPLHVPPLWLTRGR